MQSTTATDLPQPVLCLCNYGLVRSKTMRNRLRERGLQAGSQGMLNIPAHILDAFCRKAGTILICNKPNVKEDFCKEAGMTKRNAFIIKRVLLKHQAKTIIVDDIGRDKWAKENHPDLIQVCDGWLDNLGQ